MAAPQSAASSGAIREQLARSVRKCGVSLPEDDVCFLHGCTGNVSHHVSPTYVVEGNRIDKRLLQVCEPHYRRINRHFEGGHSKCSRNGDKINARCRSLLNECEASGGWRFKTLQPHRAARCGPLIVDLRALEDAALAARSPSALAKVEAEAAPSVLPRAQPSEPALAVREPAPIRVPSNQSFSATRSGQKRSRSGEPAQGWESPDRASASPHAPSPCCTASGQPEIVLPFIPACPATRLATATHNTTTNAPVPPTRPLKKMRYRYDPFASAAPLQPASAVSISHDDLDLSALLDEDLGDLFLDTELYPIGSSSDLSPIGSSSSPAEDRIWAMLPLPDDEPMPLVR